MMVADFVFRKQIEWMMENTSVCDDFNDGAQKIWFSYLSHYMPDLKNGVERELGGSEYWHLAFPRVELPVLLNCSRKDLKSRLQELRRKKAPTATGGNETTNRFNIDYSDLQLNIIHGNFKHFRPTCPSLIAVLAIALHVCQEEILLSDLLRWVRLLKLPLIDMLPDRASASPAKLYGLIENSRTLDGISHYAELEKNVTWMASVLLGKSLTELPGIPVAPIVERFIEELNSPSEMIPFVISVAEKSEISEYHIRTGSVKRISSAYKRGKNVESPVMSCIFHVLRILFVLDDSTENRVSQFISNLQDMIPATPFFNFRVWHQHLMHRRAVLFRHTFLSRQNRNSAAHVNFTERNHIPSSVYELRRPPRGAIKNRQVATMYHDLRFRLQRDLPKPVNEGAQVFIDLPVPARPYRAHTEALSQHYPELAVDFSKHTIKHSLSEGIEGWVGPHERKREDILVEVAALQLARADAYKDMRLIRHFKNRDENRKVLVDEENLPRVVRDLIRTMADMIDQFPGYLVGNLVYLELAFFPQLDIRKNIQRARKAKITKTL
ncbi:hypothetical protein RvY_02577 [Ramazzottius varieornatus]|uniref:Rrn7/TAF1B C-terminal cyclin domain-containing protein n=1 Tax=Ramazzottius varieornatus TaxID=947166 RepID=A0A1D1UKZ1_RAMVA|nr:hypothetical protein RvY_02577 [Ramazzottius varieornatus]